MKKITAATVMASFVSLAPVVAMAESAELAELAAAGAEVPVTSMCLAESGVSGSPAQLIPPGVVSDGCLLSVVTAVLACAAAVASGGLAVAACAVAVFAAQVICTCLSAVGFVNWVWEMAHWLVCNATVGLLQPNYCGPMPDFNMALDANCQSQLP